MAGYYDKNKDYSKELQRTDLSSSERERLTQERQNKIDDKYGGKEPNMIGSDKTYSQVSGSSSGGSSGRFNGVSYDRSNNGGGLYGAPTSNSQQKNVTKNGTTYRVGPDLSRRQDLAGGYQISNGYTVFYDKNGYATRASKGTADYTPGRDANAANGTYNSAGAWTDNEILTAEDRQKIAAIRAQLQAGKITGDEANKAANAIRSGYGYTIDKNGYVTDNGALSRVNDFRQRYGLSTMPEGEELTAYRELLGETPSRTELLQKLVDSGYNTSDSGKPSFDYSYDSEMRALIDEILNGSLSDWKQGDQYDALRKQYAENGELSMANLLGQVSSRTGGLASSYATNAAGQEMNSWMSKLEQAAQEMYQQERQDKLNNLGVLNDLYDREYNEYGDQLNQWNTDRNFNYQAGQDARDWDYQLSQDEYSKALQQAETMAQYGNFSGYKALGYTDAQIGNMQKQYNLLRSTGSSGRKSSGGSTSSGSGAADYDGLFSAALQSGYPESYIANHYKEYGFDKSTGLSKEYSQWAEEQEDSAYNGSYFNAAMNTIRTMLDQGKTDHALGGLDSMWNKLSAQQKAQVQSVLAKYGLTYEG